MAFFYMLLVALSATSAMSHLTGTEKCGKPAIQPNLMDRDRIEGGVEVIPGSWPWHAELNTADNQHLCSGALISDQYVLTAAKCLCTFNADQRKLECSKNIKVHLGSHTRNEKDQGEVWLKVEQACVQPNYTGDHKNNIAIVKLEKKVDFTDRISPICLPQKNQRLPSTVYGTGWGHSHADHTHSHDHHHDHDHDHDHEHGDERAPRLRQAYVDVVPNDQCYDEFGQEAVSTVFCTTLKQGSPCKHDLGGPISQKVGNIWTLFGIVSGGAAGCKVGEHPMLHTRVPLYLDSLINYYANSHGQVDNSRCLLV